MSAEKMTLRCKLTASEFYFCSVILLAPLNGKMHSCTKWEMKELTPAC